MEMLDYKKQTATHCVVLIKAPPYQGEAFSFCTVSSAGGAAHGLPILCHPYIYKSAFCIHMLNILMQVLIPRLHQFFRKFGEIKPLIRYTQYSTYCIVVLIPRLLKFFRKFGKISGSGPSLIFFRQIRTLSP